LDSKQAGVVLGCSPTAYRLRLLRARKRLENALEEAEKAERQAPIPETRLQERC
jgi:DNA-directed RNA polymerase specialized sigma24 family protein